MKVKVVEVGYRVVDEEEKVKVISKLVPNHHHKKINGVHPFGAIFVVINNRQTTVTLDRMEER